MQVVCKVADKEKVLGEDWDSLMWHNGKLFSASFSNGNVKVWSSDLKPVTEFPAHDYPINHMTPGNGTTFFTSCTDCVIKHWEEMEDGSFRLLTTLEGHVEPPRKLRFLNGRLYSGDDKGDVKIWQDGKCLVTVETMEEIWDLLAVDGRFVTVRHVDVTLFAITERDGKIRTCVKNSIPGRSPLNATDNGLLCCIDRNENVVKVHELEKQGNSLIGKLKGHEAIINSMISTGTILITGGSDNKVIVWNLENFQQVGETIPIDGYVNVLAASPDGLVYAAGENKLLVCIRL